MYIFMTKDLKRSDSAKAYQRIELLKMNDINEAENVQLGEKWWGDLTD